MRDFWRRLKKRILPMFDMTAMVMSLTGSAVLYVVDPTVLRTIVPWMLVSMILAAHSVVLTRMWVPQIDLSEWVRRARDGSVAGALVILAVSVLLAAAFMGVVLWSKA